MSMSNTENQELSWCQICPHCYDANYVLTSYGLQSRVQLLIMKMTQVHEIAPNHYLNQCWLIINGVLWHSSKTSFTGCQFVNCVLKKYTCKITSTVLRANELLQTPWRLLGIYWTKEDFGLNLLILSMVIHRCFTGPTHLLSANVREPVSLAVSVVVSCWYFFIYIYCCSSFHRWVIALIWTSTYDSHLQVSHQVVQLG